MINHVTRKPSFGKQESQESIGRVFLCMYNICIAILIGCPYCILIVSLLHGHIYREFYADSYWILDVSYKSQHTSYTTKINRIANCFTAIFWLQ